MNGTSRSKRSTFRCARSTVSSAPGIPKVSELLDLTEDEIMKMRNFGKKSLDEIKQVLAERGLSLRLT